VKALSSNSQDKYRGYTDRGSSVFLSVIIPTYNRSEQVLESIRSAIDSFEGNTSYEVIVVDDASTDATRDILRSEFLEEIDAGRLRIVINDYNRGVAGSRNVGYELSQGAWVLCLDSDDQLLVGASDKILSILSKNSDRSIVFFRCVDEKGQFVGKQLDKDVSLDLKTYLEHTSYGEVLVGLNKRLVRSPPFIEELRGYEGLAISKIIKKTTPALLSTVVARRYNRGSDDRLSSSRGFLGRMPLLASGHLRMIKEFHREMSAKKLVSYFIKAGIYLIIGTMYRAINGRISR